MHCSFGPFITVQLTNAGCFLSESGKDAVGRRCADDIKDGVGCSNSGGGDGGIVEKEKAVSYGFGGSLRLGSALERFPDQPSEEFILRTNK